MHRGAAWHITPLGKSPNHREPCRERDDGGVGRLVLALGGQFNSAHQQTATADRLLVLARVADEDVVLHFRVQCRDDQRRSRARKWAAKRLVWYASASNEMLATEKHKIDCRLSGLDTALVVTKNIPCERIDVWIAQQDRQLSCSENLVGLCHT